MELAPSLIAEWPVLTLLTILLSSEAFASIEPGYNPPITYVICGKRHHIRFFPSTQDGGDRSGNVRAGTVIDLDIVHPTDNDFVSSLLSRVLLQC